VDNGVEESVDSPVHGDDLVLLAVILAAELDGKSLGEVEERVVMAEFLVSIEERNVDDTDGVRRPSASVLGVLT